MNSNDAGLQYIQLLYICKVIPLDIFLNDKVVFVYLSSGEIISLKTCGQQFDTIKAEGT